LALAVELYNTTSPANNVRILHMLRAILWDNDGVLVDSERIYFEVNRDYFARHSVQLSEQNFFDWYLARDCAAWHLLAEQGMSPIEIAQCRIERNDLYTQRLMHEDCLLSPGITEVLAKLHPLVRMAVVTSCNKEHFAVIHRNGRLAKYFDFVLTAETYAKVKPAPDPYLKALEALSLSASDCVAVEDSPRGLTAARSAGIKCIVVRSPLTRQCKFAGAYRVVDSMSQLADELQNLLYDAPG
jgi:HAD superfamily hydrolase (TIGR01509 family)